jgi:hypothetical protein
MKSSDSKKDSDVLKGIFKKITLEEARLLLQIVCRDPFTGLYKKTLVLYAIFLTLVLLWPFEFTFTGKMNHVKWSDASPGIEFIEDGQVISRPFSRPFFENLVKGKGFSLEVSIVPANNQQRGPARIVSYSLNPNYRNFTLGQQGMDLIMRMRTKNTNLNGMDPELVVQDVFTRIEPLHIVVSYNFEEQRVYVNGSIRTTSTIPGANFKNWDPEYPLILGNEATGDRPWLGKISYVAIYNYPLDAQAVRSNYEKVRNWISGNVEMAAPKKGLVVRYLLDERKGNKVTDSGTLVESLTLNIPDEIQTENKPFLGFPLYSLTDWGSGYFYEIVLNVLLFVPLGFLLHAIIASRVDGNWKPLFFVMIVGTAITLSAETLQYFSELRHSSLKDVIANLIGSLLGIQLQKMHNNAFLTRNKRMVCKATEEQITSSQK